MSGIAVKKAADIPDAVVLEIVQACNDGQGHWAYTQDIAEALAKQGYEAPPKIVAAKLSKMLRRKLLDGCDCGCRGDWEIPERPLRFPRQPEEGA